MLYQIKQLDNETKNSNVIIEISLEEQLDKQLKEQYEKRKELEKSLKEINVQNAESIEIKSYVHSFRSRKRITSHQLKILSCTFWKIEPDRDQKGKFKYDKKTGEPIYDHFIIIDEDLEEIPSNQLIDSYFQKKQTEFIYGQVHLKYLNDDELEQRQLDIQNGNQKVLKIKQVKNAADQLKDFKYRYPGIDFHFDIDLRSKSSRLQRKKEDMQFGDQHIGIYLLYLILLTLHITSFELNYPIKSLYFNQRQISMFLGLDTPLMMNPYEDFQGNLQFSQISKVDDLFEFIDQKILNNLFSQIGGQNFVSEDESIVFQKQQAIGQLRIRQCKTIEMDCPGYWTSSFVTPKKCFAQNYEQIKNRQYRKIFYGDSDLYGSWRDYQDAFQSQIDGTTDGYYTSYDGSGFIKDFSTQLPISTVKSQFKELISNQFYDSSTRAMMFSFTLYNPSIDFYFYVNLVVEFSNNGNLTPNPAQIFPFKANIYQGSTGYVLYMNDVIKVMIASGLIIFCFYNSAIALPNSEETIGSIKYLSTFQGGCNIAIALFAMISAAFGINQSVMGLSNESLFYQEKYIDLGSAANKFTISLMWGSLMAATVIIRLSTVFRIDNRFKFTLMTFEKSGSMIIIYTFFLMPIYIGLSIIASNIWGSYMREFSTYSSSFVQMIFLLVGQVDISEMAKWNFSSTIAFLLVYQFVVQFFLMSVFLGIYIEKYRTSILDYGYTGQKINIIDTDNDPDDNCEEWTRRDFMRWILNFLPQKTLRQLKLA